MSWKAMPRFDPNSPEMLHCFLIRAGDHGAGATGCAHESRCFGCDDFHVFRFGDFPVVGVLQFQELAFHHAFQHIAEQPDEFEVSAFHRDGGSRRVQKISSQHRCGVSPHLSNRGLTPSQVCVVEHIIVEQRCGMNILKDGRESVNIPPLVSTKMRGKHKEQRPDPFPSPQQGIANDVCNDRDPGAKRLIQGVIDFFERKAEVI